MRRDENTWSHAGRLAAGLLCASLAATPSAADVTVRAQTTTSSFGLSTDALTVTSIKGHRMRLETTIRGQVLTSLIDLDLARYVTLDYTARTAHVFDMRPSSARLRPGGATGVPAAGGTSSDANPAVTLTPTGQTQAFAGQACEEYKVDARAAASNSDAAARLEGHGVAWVAPGNLGRGDWAAFHRAVVERGLSVTDPRVVDVDPARASLITAVYAGVAERGVPCSMRLELAYGDAAPGVGSVSQAGRAVLESSVSDVSTATLPDDLFEIPAGYTTIRQ